MNHRGWVYMMSDRYRSGIYTGVTAYLAERVTRHKEGRGSEFVARYGFTRLIYVERHGDIRDAIRREKAIKKWWRAWKIELIERMNPDWSDLYYKING
jgi:putative endonuclease